MSGGRATVAHKKGELVRQAGDICAVAPEGHELTDRFYLECKFYRDLALPSFLLKGQGTLAQFWAQTSTLAAARGRVPMLVAKQNGFPPMVLLPVPPQSFPDLLDQGWRSGTTALILLSKLLAAPYAQFKALTYLKSSAI